MMPAFREMPAFADPRAREADRVILASPGCSAVSESSAARLLRDGTPVHL